MDIRSFLEAADAAALVIKQVADTPGVNMLPYANTVSSTISALRFAYEKGKNIESYVADFKDTFANGVPSQEKLDAQNAKIAALRAELHAPLPPKEDGEPD